MAKDDKTRALAPRGAKDPSPQMVRLIRIVRVVGTLLGGVVTLVALMGVVGLVTSSFLARMLVALVVGLGVPAVVADRILKKTGSGDGLAKVGDVFAIVLLAIALFFVGLDLVGRPLFVGEGDRYARSGSRGMARFAYWLGGVTPVFPEERGLPATAGRPPEGSSEVGPATSASASASSSPGGGP